jgi:hypothetical protein
MAKSKFLISLLALAVTLTLSSCNQTNTADTTNTPVQVNTEDSCSYMEHDHVVSTLPEYNNHSEQFRQEDYSPYEGYNGLQISGVWSIPFRTQGVQHNWPVKFKQGNNEDLDAEPVHIVMTDPSGDIMNLVGSLIYDFEVYNDNFTSWSLAAILNDPDFPEELEVDFRVYGTRVEQDTILSEKCVLVFKARDVLIMKFDCSGKWSRLR